MEIGFSSDQLVDIGLNVAGFITAGTLLILIQSLFSSKKHKRIPETTRKSVASAACDQPTPEKPAEDVRSKVEFVDLKGVDWREGEKDHHLDTKGNYRLRNRKDIIRMATKILHNYADEAASSDTSPTADDDSLLNGQNINLQGAGRNR